MRYCIKLKGLAATLALLCFLSCNSAKENAQDALTNQMEKAIEAKTGEKVDLGTANSYENNSGSVSFVSDGQTYLKSDDKLQAIAIFQKDKDGLAMSFQLTGAEGKSLVVIIKHIPEDFKLPLTGKFAVSNSYDGVNPVATMILMQTSESGVLNSPMPFEGTLTVSKLTEAEIAAIVGINANEIKLYQKNFDGDIATAMLLFTWQNGNEVSVKVNGKERKLNGSSSIGIGRLMKLSKAEFDEMYRARTKEEIGAEINQIVQNKDVDTDIAIYEAKELAKKAKSLSFTKLENVGTAAYWETPLNVLHVLANDITVSISTNLQEDETGSKQKAIALANLIFKKSTP